jgi:hypothetical protein
MQLFVKYISDSSFFYNYFVFVESKTIISNKGFNWIFYRDIQEEVMNNLFVFIFQDINN